MYALSRLLLAAATAVGLLAGCGGGSDDDAGIPANTPYNVRAAVANLLGTGGEWTVQGTGNDGVVYRFTWRMTPTSTGTFALDGKTYNRTVQSFTTRQGSTTLPTEDTTLYHDLATVTLVGARDADGTCSGFSTVAALPTTAIAGDSGTFYQTTSYTGCTTASGTVSVTQWSVYMYKGRPYFCLATTSANNDVREIDCVQINTNGTLGDRALVQIDGVRTDGSIFSVLADN